MKIGKYRILNACSNRPFIFDTGDVLPGVRQEYILDEMTMESRERLEYYYQMWLDDKVDIILVNLSILDWLIEKSCIGPFRVPIIKDGKVSSTKFRKE